MSVGISPAQTFCFMQNRSLGRAILSWNTPPLADSPDWTPVWGYVVDAQIQFAEYRGVHRCLVPVANRCERRAAFAVSRLRAEFGATIGAFSNLHVCFFCSASGSLRFRRSGWSQLNRRPSQQAGRFWGGLRVGEVHSLVQSSKPGTSAILKNCEISCNDSRQSCTTSRTEFNEENRRCHKRCNSTSTRWSGAAGSHTPIKDLPLEPGGIHFSKRPPPGPLKQWSAKTR